MNSKINIIIVKKILIFTSSIILSFLMINNTFAEKNIEDSNIFEKIKFEKNIKVKENIKIDLTNIETDIKNFYKSQ
jgi:hypothetical protein